MTPQRPTRWPHLLAVTGILAIAACATEADEQTAAACAASGGKWIADTRECEI